MTIVGAAQPLVDSLKRSAIPASCSCVESWFVTFAGPVGKMLDDWSDLDSEVAAIIRLADYFSATLSMALRNQTSISVEEYEALGKPLS